MKATSFFRAVCLLPAVAAASVSISQRSPMSAVVYHRLCHPAHSPPLSNPTLARSKLCSFLAHHLTGMLTRPPFALFALADVSTEVD